MKKYTWGIISILGVASVVGAYFYFVPKTTNTEEITYQEVAVRKGDISLSFSADGVIQGEIVSISAPLSEKIVKMNVAVGSSVKKGQALFSIDRTKLQYQYNAAMAVFSKAVYERNQIDEVVKPDAYKAAQQVVNSTYSQVQIAKLALEQADAKSPVNGIVAEVNIHAGEYPTASQGAIIKIVKKDSLYISTFLDESEAGKLTKATPVTIDLDALGKKVQGTIVSVAPMAVKDSAGYSVYPVSIAISDKTLPISIGFEGTVQFITKVTKDVLQIPVTAVFTENAKTYVLKKIVDGKERIEVSTGFTDGKNVEVKSGLTQEDIVLIKK